MAAVAGIRELVDLYQIDYAAHVFRRLSGDAWSFQAAGGADATLRLESVDLDLPLSDIYRFTEPGTNPDHNPTSK